MPKITDRPVIVPSTVTTPSAPPPPAQTPREEAKTEARQFWGAVGQQTAKTANQVGAAVGGAVNATAQGVKDLGHQVSSAADQATQAAQHAMSRFAGAAASLLTAPSTPSSTPPLR